MDYQPLLVALVLGIALVALHPVVGLIYAILAKGVIDLEVQLAGFVLSLAIGFAVRLLEAWQEREE